MPAWFLRTARRAPLFFHLKILDVTAAGAQPFAVDSAVDCHGLGAGSSDHVHGSGELLRAIDCKMLTDTGRALVVAAVFGEFHFAGGVGPQLLLAAAVVGLSNVQAALNLLRRHAMLGECW